MPLKTMGLDHIFAGFCTLGLTSSKRGLACIYHLRSNSGSNGPIAKESHRFLVAGPFNFCAVYLGTHSPACCIAELMSKTLHSSLIFPCRKRKIVMPGTAMRLPLAGNPIPSPVLVPEALQ